MKRSKFLKLTLMGAASSSLMGCGGEPRTPVVNYSDISECMNDMVFTEEQCAAQYMQAKELAAQDAPKYTEGRDCEADFGYQGCERHGSFWQPMMAGFMMSQLANSVSSGIHRSKHKSRPLYRSSDDANSYRTANNVKVGAVGDTRPRSAPNSLLTPSQAQVYKRSGSMGQRANTLKRGGFGKSGFRSSFGG